MSLLITDYHTDAYTLLQICVDYNQPLFLNSHGAPTFRDIQLNLDPELISRYTPISAPS